MSSRPKIEIIKTKLPSTYNRVVQPNPGGVSTEGLITVNIKSEDGQTKDSLGKSTAQPTGSGLGLYAGRYRYYPDPDSDRDIIPRLRKYKCLEDKREAMRVRRRLRSKTLVNILNQYPRWKCCQVENKLKTHENVAKFLLDSYYNQRSDISRSRCDCLCKMSKAASSTVSIPSERMAFTDSTLRGKQPLVRRLPLTSKERESTSVVTDSISADINQAARREHVPSVTDCHRRESNPTERLLQTVPGVVQVQLYIKPEDQLVTLRSECGSIVYGEVLQNDKYYIDLVDEHRVQLHGFPGSSIKEETEDPDYDQALAESSCWLDSMDSDNLSQNDTDDQCDDPRSRQITSGDLAPQSDVVMETSSSGCYAAQACTETDLVHYTDDREVNKSPVTALANTNWEDLGQPVETTLEGGVESHHNCQYCDFTTSDWDTLVRHMKSSHQIDVFDLEAEDPSVSSDENSSFSDGSAGLEDNKPDDFVTKETDNGRDIYKCKLCSYTFKRESAALSHVKMKHVDKEMASFFNSTTRDNANETKKHKAGSDESFSPSDSSDLADYDEEETEPQHKQKFAKYIKTTEEEGVTTYECMLCGERFTTVISISKHISETHKQQQTQRKRTLKTFICDLCGESCVGRVKLSQHMKQKHKTKKQPAAKRVYRRSKSHYERWRESQPVLCSVEGCGKTLPNRLVLSYHVNTAHGRKTACDICGKEFRNKAYARRHKNQIHLRERNLICPWPDCGKLFGTNWHLKVHMRIHTDEKPLQCEYCGFTARQSNSLRYHVKTHHKEFAQTSKDKT